MLLRKGDIVREESNPPMIEYYMQHGYEEVFSVTLPGGRLDIGEPVIVFGKRGKKADQPPADLGKLADDLSKSEDHD